MRRVFIFSISLLFLASCMHKSVMEGEADDIVTTKIYDFKDGKYLVTLESIFQATSKKSGGGFTSISGYNDLRLTTYDLKTGKRLIRKKMGKEQKHPIVMLGFTEGNLWFYSEDDGLHSRDPKTLEIKTTQDKIVEKNSYLKDNFATCEWYQLGQFYSFSILTNKLIVSDKQGFRYAIDPTSLVAEKLPDDFKFPNASTNTPFETSSEFNQQYLGFEGDLRKQISKQSKPVNPDLTFLDGKFIIDNNLSRVLVAVNEKYLFYKELHDGKNKEFEDFKAKHGSDYWKLKNDQYKKFRNLEDSLRDIARIKDDYERKVNSIVDYGRLTGGNPLLMTDSISFFVIHKTSTAKDALMNISKVQLKNNKELKEMWQTKLDGIFYDYNAACETSSFKVVFSKGNPKFDYMFADIVDNKLVIVYMLHSICIDTESGKIQWKFRL
jgi:hypothetical protein